MDSPASSETRSPASITCARHYIPAFGRFLTRDSAFASIGDLSSLNRYSYAESNPTDLTDPSGRCLEDLCIAEGTALVYIGMALVAWAGTEMVAHSAVTRDAYSSTLSPGTYAGNSIPASGPGCNISSDDRAKIDRLGADTGCHTCRTKDAGTKSGHFVPDHQPPSALNTDGTPQRLYPRCLSCSRKQGGEVRQAQRDALEQAKIDETDNATMGDYDTDES